MSPPLTPPPAVQDDPPNVGLAALVAIRLLRDVHDRLSASSDEDLRGRCDALREVMTRIYFAHSGDEQ